jgi:exodeoxyribonuclease I
MAFVFYDVETTGVHKHFDQVLQFAAIRTDADLNEIDRFEIRCRLLPHIVPSPGALKVTNVSISQLLDPSLPSHYEMMCAIADKLAEWSPSVFLGWNTLEFDEELIRQAFWQCLHPPFMTNTNGNARTDLLRVVQALTMDMPNVLALPIGDNGNPSFKLDRLAPANGFANMKAHDALGDVEATIHLARIVMNQAGDHWSEALRFCSKASALAFMEAEDVFLVTECYFQRPYRYALTQLSVEPAGSVLAYDLTVDPDALRGLSDQALAARLQRSPKPVRRVRAHKSPLLRDLSSIDHFKGLTPNQLEYRAYDVRADQSLIDRLIEASAREALEAAPFVEGRIYEGFPANADQSRMRDFHKADWQTRAKIVEEFEDARLIELGLRLLHNHCPEALSDTLRLSLTHETSCRLTGYGFSDPEWLTLDAAVSEAENMTSDCDVQQQALILELLAHLRAEQSRCMSRLSN